MEFLRPFLLRRHFAGKPVVALPNIGCFLNLVPRVLSGFDGRRERTLGRRLFFCSYCRFWLLLTHSTHLLKDSAHNPTEPAPRPDPVQYHRRLLLCRLCNLHQPMSLWKKNQYHKHRVEMWTRSNWKITLDPDMKITLKQTMQTQIFHFGMFPLPNIKYGAFSKCTFLAPFNFINHV